MRCRAARASGTDLSRITTDTIMANETRPLLVYTYREQSWERRRFRFPALKSLWPIRCGKRRQDFLPGLNPWRARGPTSRPLFACCCSPSPPPRPSSRSSVRVFRHRARRRSANPAESSAYSAAISQPDPGARASAIQQFLIQYPNSSLRQPAIAQMMLAKREAHTPGASPPAP